MFGIKICYQDPIILPQVLNHKELYETEKCRYIDSVTNPKVFGRNEITTKEVKIEHNRKVKRIKSNLDYTIYF